MVIPITVLQRLPCNHSCIYSLVSNRWTNRGTHMTLPVPYFLCKVPPAGSERAIRTPHIIGLGPQRVNSQSFILKTQTFFQITEFAVAYLS